MFTAVTAVPPVVIVAFQVFTNAWLPPQVQVTFQLLEATVPVLLTVTLVTKPLFHWLVTEEVAEHLAVPVLPTGVGVTIGVGEAVRIGVAVGVATGVGEAVRTGVAVGVPAGVGVAVRTGVAVGVPTGVGVGLGPPIAGKALLTSCTN